jgi:hypothetical protein
MLRPALLGVGLLALCVACAPRAPKVYNVERGRTYAEDRAVVWERVQRFLQENGITVTEADPATGVIEAERSDFQDAVWAECERAWVSDPSMNSPSPSRASPISRDLALEVTVREPLDRRPRARAAGRAGRHAGGTGRAPGITGPDHRDPRFVRLRLGLRAEGHPLARGRAGTDIRASQRSLRTC